jgi:hypothetical protein
MKKLKISMVVGLAVLNLQMLQVAHASSHREAPFITSQPKLDGTDFYMFNSYEPKRAGYVTLIANYLPFQDPQGGPNFYSLDPNALYEINISNDGQAKENITFQFRFQNKRKDLALQIGPNGSNVSVPVLNIGDATNPANVGVVETYTVGVVRNGRRAKADLLTATGSGSSTFTKPVDNIGKKSIADYPAYAQKFIYDVNIPGCLQPGRVFVGQRKEPFYISVGQAFDLFNYKNPVGPRNSEINNLDVKNVTSLALEVPTTCLTSGTETVIGGWTTASTKQARLLVPTPDSSKEENMKVSREGGSWVQVSRVGMPLVNEVVIGMKDKDRFNSSIPSGDSQFLSYVTNPVLPQLIQTLFSVPAPVNPRNDLVTAFLTGVPSVNQPKNVVPSEMLRLNTAIPATPAAQQQDLGALNCFVNGALNLNNPGCDPAGFPNGRRPIDDVTDISLRVAEGVLMPNHNAAADKITDGVQLPTPAANGGVGAGDFQAVFPYINNPLPGAN